MSVFARLRAAALVCAAATVVLGCKKGAPGDGDGGLDGGLDGAVVTASDAGAIELPSHAAAVTPSDDANIPPAASDELDARMKHLLEAIAQDQPELAQDVLFPRKGYVDFADAKDPGKAWDTKVKASFDKSIHKLHKTKGIERSTFSSFELGKNIVHTAAKKKELKSPTWRVKHSKLYYMSEGHTKTLVLAELTSWKGAWYVTRLR
jgi:hypothetical protein